MRENGSESVEDNRLTGKRGSRDRTTIDGKRALLGYGQSSEVPREGEGVLYLYTYIHTHICVACSFPEAHSLGSVLGTVGRQACWEPEKGSWRGGKGEKGA